MRLISLIFISIFLLGCEFSRDTSAEQSELSEEQEWVVPNLEGHWELTSSSVEEKVPAFAGKTFTQEELDFMPVMEGGPFEYISQYDLVFTADSVFKIEYPMELFSGGAYNLDSHYLHFDGGNYKKLPFEVFADTMFTYRAGSDGTYLKEKYVKTAYQDSILNILKRDTLNYPMLAGNWILHREYWYDYGTHYWLEYPYEIPDSISLSREQILKKLRTDKTILMKTNGKLKTYRLDYKDPHLYLRPTEWYKGEDPYIHFYRSNYN